MYGALIYIINSVANKIFTEENALGGIVSTQPDRH